MKVKTIQELRKKAAERKRRIVLHSDGRPMDDESMVFPHIVGTQVDACTYSLVHQFNLCRLYRSKVGQEWPPGYIKSCGDGPDDLQLFIDFCQRNNYEAFWTMRVNDTHDAADYEDARWKLRKNKFKQGHPEFLTGSEERQPPHGRWTAVNYRHPEVREQVFRILEEVCQNYDVDGLLLDFFRHPTFFKSTAWGKRATQEEITMMSGLIQRIRNMMDEIGAGRGRALLLAVRCPDSLEYCRALGLGLEEWMRSDLIDIWIPTGYFRLQEWKEIVKIGHQYGIQVWASLDESRLTPMGEGYNSPQVYRARTMNAWRAGVDAIDLFNFFYGPAKAQFQLLYELGDPKKLAHLNKTYVPDARGRTPSAKLDGQIQENLANPAYWLRGGERFFTRPTVFSPAAPRPLQSGKPQVVDLLIGDDLSSAQNEGIIPRATLTIEVKGITASDDIQVKFNNHVLRKGMLSGQSLEYALNSEMVKRGSNRIVIVLQKTNGSKPILSDLRLSIRYEPK